MISLVVAVTAAVMRLICAPTSAVAAVFSRRGDEGERGARVASGTVNTKVLIMKGKLTDRSSVYLNSSVEVSKQTDSVRTPRQDRTGDRETAQGKDREVRKTHDGV